MIRYCETNDSVGAGIDADVSLRLVGISKLLRLRRRKLDRVVGGSILLVTAGLAVVAPESLLAALLIGSDAAGAAEVRTRLRR